MPDGDDLDKPEVFSCSHSCLLPSVPAQSRVCRPELELAKLLMIDTAGNSKPLIVNDSASVRVMRSKYNTYSYMSEIGWL